MLPPKGKQKIEKALAPRRNRRDAPATWERASWTFLTNHAHVLLCLSSEPEVLMRDIADRVGITERAVQRIIAELVEAGHIVRVRHGRRNQYRVRGDLPLRHPIERHVRVSALIEFVAGESSLARRRAGDARRTKASDARRTKAGDARRTKAGDARRTKAGDAQA